MGFFGANQMDISMKGVWEDNIDDLLLIFTDCATLLGECVFH